MLGLISTGIWSICCVNTANWAIVQNWAIEWYGPFRTIEAHYVYHFSLGHTYFLQTLGKSHCLIMELFPCPHKFFIIPHDVQGRIISSLTRCSTENCRDGFWLQIFAYSCASHFDGYLLINICRPVKILSVFFQFDILHTVNRNINSLLFIQSLFIKISRSTRLVILWDISKMRNDVHIHQICESWFHLCFEIRL